MSQIEIKKGTQLSEEILTLINKQRKKEWDDSKPLKNYSEDKFFLLYDKENMVAFAVLKDITINYLNRNYNILGLSNLIAIKKRKGFGEKLIKYIKKYAKRKTILGFTEKHNKIFYERCGLNLNKPLILRFIYNKKIYEGEDLVIYLDGKDNFVKTVISTKEKVILNTPFW